MDQAEIISRLFSNVLDQDIQRFHVNQAAIRTGIQNMKEVYKPNPTSLSAEILDVANYNDAAHRCAYLHKYAPIHTALVVDMFSKAVQVENIKRTLREFLAINGQITLCSLGGGPGSDVIGVISVLLLEFGVFQLSTTIIDYMENWKSTFATLIKELRLGNYGQLGYIVQPQHFEWNYIGHNLLGKMTNEVNKTIQGANLVTMVKFVSAAACKDTSEMINKIFRSLRSGALVLYIDNAGGGFHQIMQRCARNCGMITVFGPMKHQHYSNSSFNIKKFGYTPCLETKVTIHVWKKPNLNMILNIDSNYMSDTPTIQPTVTRTVNNTINQYNINANFFIADASSSRFPQNQPHASQRYTAPSFISENRSNVSQKYVHNPRLARTDGRPSRLTREPIQQEPRRQILSNASNQQSRDYSDDQFRNSDGPDDCCGCCVIS